MLAMRPCDPEIIWIRCAIVNLDSSQEVLTVHYQSNWSPQMKTFTLLLHIVSRTRSTTSSISSSIIVPLVIVVVVVVEIEQRTVGNIVIMTIKKQGECKWEKTCTHTHMWWGVMWFSPGTQHTSAAHGWMDGDDLPTHPPCLFSCLLSSCSTNTSPMAAYCGEQLL